MITLHDTPDLDWPDDTSRRWLSPLLRDGTASWIPNVDTDLRVALVDGEVAIPYTIGSHQPTNSYVCSPFNHYIAYGKTEIHKLESPATRAAMDAIVGPVGRWFEQARFDDVVFVNNWLLSTNLYPRWTPHQAVRLLRVLAEAHPEHAIVFRSVDLCRNRPLYDALQGEGARMVFSRRVLFADPRERRVWRKRAFKIDLKLMRKSPYEVVDGQDLDDTDIPRLSALYRQLYIEKYSKFNPVFSPKLLRRLLREGLWTFRALRRDGRIDGVMAFYERNGMMTSPLFGYDTDLPHVLGLYRMLSAIVQQEGRDRGLLTHLSAGVGRFKRLRGAEAYREYNGVYLDHLPRWRRAPWAFLQRLADHVGVGLIEKYNL